MASFPSSETIMRVELPNGIVVLVYENHTSPSVVLSGYLWAGSLSEAREQAGLARFTSSMLMRGTATRSFSQINDTLESAGAQLGFRSGVHTAGFGGKALADDLDLLLDILADCLQQPTFPLVEVEKLRGQVLTDLQRRAHDTRRMARLTFDSLLYPGHPYGRSVLGYEETVSALESDRLVAYYQDHYSPEGMVVVLVGAVSAGTVLDRVGELLGGWQPPAATPNRTIPTAVHLDKRRREEVFIAGKTQADIVLGWPGLARGDPDFIRAYVANTILGIFGMMGRLGKNVRDQQGLAYYDYSQLEAGVGSGPWLAFAGVNPENVERAIAGILDEVRRLGDELLPGDELADSQSFLTGSMPLRLETNEGIARTILNMEQHGLGLDYLQRYAGLINDVTVHDVQEMVCTYLDPEVYALSIAGPGKNDR